MPDPSNEEPLFFDSPEAFRRWLSENHQSVDVQWVGFYKKATGMPSITWPESVDEALCFGWIDGLRRSIDEQAYKIRFTPRRSTSHWSAKNLARMAELLEEGRVHAAGRRAFDARDPRKEAKTSYEQDTVELPEEYAERLRGNERAWVHFQAARPSYRKQVTWWIVSAKRKETRERRLQSLIESSAEGLLIPPLRWTEKGKTSS